MKATVAVTCIAGLLLFVLGACATTDKLLSLNAGMSKGQVIQVMGAPDAARGRIENWYGQTIEVWEYLEYKSGSDALARSETPYWLLFHDGYLVQWGEAGNWKRTPHRIYETRFR
jgi:hypothetical protein